MRRKINEKPYAAEKKGRDKFYPELSRGKERSFFVVAKSRADIALKYQTFLQFDFQSNWDRAS